MGTIISCRKDTEITVTKQVINRVGYLAKLYGMKSDLSLKTRKGDLYQDDYLLPGVEYNNNLTRQYYILNEQ